MGRCTGESLIFLDQSYPTRENNESLHGYQERLFVEVVPELGFVG